MKKRIPGELITNLNLTYYKPCKRLLYSQLNLLKDALRRLLKNCILSSLFLTKDNDEKYHVLPFYRPYASDEQIRSMVEVMGWKYQT